MGLDYTYLDATYQSAETLTAAANSSQDASGNIRVQPGDRLPLTPRHLVKLRADYRFSPQWRAGVAMRAVAGSLARGNENGQHQSDGVYNLGPGPQRRLRGVGFDRRIPADDPTDRVWPGEQCL